MVAAHEGLSPSPLFGTTGVQPVFDEGGIAAAGEMPADGFDAGSPDVFPERPAGMDGVESMDGMAAVDQVRPAEQAGGPIPPAGVGETTGGTRRTTLFDLLTGG